MKAIRISLEEIKEKEYSSEVISTMKEKIFPDNSGNGMPNKQHWFTKQISKLEKYFYINEETQTYYFTIVEKDYEIRELTLSKDNWNRYNHIFEVLTYDPNNAYFELDIQGKGNLEEQTSDFYICLPACTLLPSNRFILQPNSSNKISMLFNVINYNNGKLIIE